MTEPTQRRLTLLYEIYLLGQASRQLMRHAMAGSGLTGEEFALYSYLHVNGPRTLTQGAADLGMPLTTLATLLAGPIERREIERGPHPDDRRARLLRLTDAGEARWASAGPAFAGAYQVLLAELDEDGADVEALFAALATLREGIGRAADALEATASSAAGRGRTPAGS